MIYRFAHISDLHLPPLPAARVGELLNKRMLGYLSWHRKRKHRHRAEVVSALESSLREQNADHICITGDISNLALAAEFRAAARWLHAAAPADRATFVPGNHDAYVAAGIRAMGEELGPWLPAEYPSSNRRGPVLFIGVTSAVATPPLLASGRVGAHQLARLAALLDETRDSGLFRVLLIHHPPQAGRVAARKRLVDAGALAALLKDRRVDLVLHGHGHRPTAGHLPSPAGAIPVCGAGSGSLYHPDPARAGHYHVFELSDAALGVTHLHYHSEQDRFVARRGETLPRRSECPLAG